jgi:hypothetical protein
MRSSRALEAVKAVEVAVTAHISGIATAAALVTLMFNGDGVQVTPGGREAAVGVTATTPRKPPVGVTVTVSVAAAPLVELSTKGWGLYDTATLPVCDAFTVTVAVPTPQGGWTALFAEQLT